MKNNHAAYLQRPGTVGLNGYILRIPLNRGFPVSRNSWFLDYTRLIPVSSFLNS